jgi:transcriptional regulator with XRE-family HTH domain
MADLCGAQLRKCRVAAGISLGRLAREVTYSKSYLSRIENGNKPLSLDIAKRCDRALRTGGTLAAMVSRPKAEFPEQTADDEFWVLELGGTGELGFRQQSQPRPGSRAALPGFVLTSRPSADEPVLTALRANFEQCRILGTMASPIAVLGPLVAQIDAVRSLALGAGGRVRTQLLLLAARMAEYAGWMSQEAGHEPAALWWTDRAVEYADAGGDCGFESYALVRRAEIALYRQDPLSTVELASLAQEDGSAGRRILGLAARCEAQGHALAGEPDRYRRALDRAAELLAGLEFRDPDELVIGSSTVTDEVALAAGWSLHDLGESAEAAVLLDGAMSSIAPAARRARARFGARRALAYATQGEVDHACELTRMVIEDAGFVDSSTVRSDLHRLSRTLMRWYRHPAAVAIKPELVAALQTRLPV